MPTKTKRPDKGQKPKEEKNQKKLKFGELHPFRADLSALLLGFIFITIVARDFPFTLVLAILYILNKYVIK